MKGMKRHSVDSIIHFILIMTSILLVSSNIFLYRKLQNVPVKGQETLEERPTFLACDTECRKEIEESILGTIEKEEKNLKGSTPQPVTREIVKLQTSYISLGSTAATSSTSWVDVPGSEVYIDLANDYGDDAKVSWETTLSVAHDNGTAYARLFDATHGIAVDASELSVKDTDTLTFVSSGSLSLWSGRNLYKAQIRSLNSFEVTYSGGKIKISH